MEGEKGRGRDSVFERAGRKTLERASRDDVDTLLSATLGEYTTHEV